MKMNKFIAVALALGVLSLSPLLADNDRVISLAELPKAARSFLNTYFTKQNPSLVTLDNDVLSKTYEVVFADGTRVEFDGKGNWQEVEARRGAVVPAGIVMKTVQSDVASRFAGQSIQHIERKRRGYEVELTNGIELEYNHKGQLQRADD